jgi:hypothetical protein
VQSEGSQWQGGCKLPQPLEYNAPNIRALKMRQDLWRIFNALGWRLADPEVKPLATFLAPLRGSKRIFKSFLDEKTLEKESWN